MLVNAEEKSAGELTGPKPCFVFYGGAIMGNFFVQTNKFRPEKFRLEPAAVLVHHWWCLVLKCLLMVGEFLRFRVLIGTFWDGHFLASFIKEGSS